MRTKINGVVGLVLGGVLVAGTVGAASCADSSSAGSNAGAGGGSTGGTGGNAANTIYDMMMSGAQEVPPNASTAAGNVRVALDRTTGAVTVTGMFANLSSTATGASLHGPAAVGMTAPPLITLTVPAAASGDVTGAGSMDTGQMNDMTAGQTYVNIQSVNFPDGEIRAQVTPGIVAPHQP